ncbi:MAG TPA: biopolymer transporter ExbD [Candidatus Acidoferrum sp.]|nr:biopolymer transporter ExbD [Candidatus Acidoferrum sp.]
MGISLGGRKFGTISEINVVPLIDILLVLLVIFMAVRPEVVFGLPVDLPQKSEITVEAPPDTIVVQVLADGTLRINQDPVQWQELQPRLKEIFKPRVGRIAFVRGEGSLEFGVIAHAIDEMRGSGITTVGLMTGELAIAQ